MLSPKESSRCGASELIILAFMNSKLNIISTPASLHSLGDNFSWINNISSEKEFKDHFSKVALDFYKKCKCAAKFYSHHPKNMEGEGI